RLNIVAHDKFQEIIDEANRGDSPIHLQQVILDAPGSDDQKVSVQVVSGVMARLGLAGVADEALAVAGDVGATPTVFAPVFSTAAERQAARMVLDVIGSYETRRDLVPVAGALRDAGIQARIRAEVAERLKPLQGNLLAGAVEGEAVLDLSAVVAARSELNTPEVRAKAAAAARWCKHASDHAAQVGGKPWKYLLIPHDEVVESKRLMDFSRFEVADVQDRHILTT
ncbi:MAG: type III restriction endonuclease subunit R, partial [Acidithiobacillus sp.]